MRGEPGQSSGPGKGGIYKVGNPYQINGVWYYPKEDPNYDETGIGSWYGDQFHGKATANKDFHGMGTTCSTLILLPAGALIAHVGDSRVYRVRDGRIDQLTFDHSLVWELVRHKHLKPEQAKKAVPRNVITRSLGPDPVVEVDIEGPLAVQPGDVFVLCSDGLSGPVEDPELLEIINRHGDLKVAASKMIERANENGGPDNITVILARWVEDRPG